ncbi:hypothetical protein F66182_3561 [Fusarium sp. NRRL 66182]|nr:hypothetical protein F66182_3561 [Fusarium sp. NRRL 66182]
MKFSIVSTILLAQGIAAMPWSSAKVNQLNNEEITLRIQVSQAPAGGRGVTPKHKGAISASLSPICLRICWSEEPRQCPEGWDARNLGSDGEPCWTCCRDTGEDSDL